jgi:hypothetical protein
MLHNNYIEWMHNLVKNNIYSLSNGRPRGGSIHFSQSLVQSSSQSATSPPPTYNQLIYILLIMTKKKKKTNGHANGNTSSESKNGTSSTVPAAASASVSSTPSVNDYSADLVSGSPTSDFAGEYGKYRVHTPADRSRHGEVILPRKFSERTNRAFLPDEIIAMHFVFRFLGFLSNWFFKPMHGYEMYGIKEQPRDKGVLFFGRRQIH